MTETPGMQLDPLGFKAIPYELRSNTDLAEYSEAPVDTWRPKLPDDEVPLRKRLPRPLGDDYVGRWRQPFSPRWFHANAVRLANYAPEDRKRAGVRDALVEQLYARLLEFTVLEGGGRFVVYRFDRRYKEVDVPAPWTSAYASGAALVGLTKLFDVFGDERFIRTADEILRGMALLRRPEGLWVTFVDEDEFLWFEEMPLPVEPQPRILNGHIRALTGLYHFHRVTGSELAGRLLRGGVTTVRHNVVRYRVPGEVNRYNLRHQRLKDYGPKRTVVQQRELFEMTGDRFFYRMSKLFAKDNAAAAAAAL